MNYREQTYFVEGQPDVSYHTAVQIWKTLYKTYDAFFKTVIIYDDMIPLGDCVAQDWNDTKEVTSSDAFLEKNLEIRRLMFRAIGVDTLFKEMEPVLLDQKELTFLNQPDPAAEPTPIKETYELYKISGSKLFAEEFAKSSMPRDWIETRSSLFAVRCYCTTTKREYWIYVPGYIGSKNCALTAIAWTVHLDISHPSFIYRHGDVIVAAVSEKSEKVNSYYLNAEQYTSLLRAQS